MKHRIGRNDIILILIIAVLGLLFLGYRYVAHHQDGGFITITVNGEEYGTYSLTTDNEIPIEEDGDACNVVVISDKKAYMSDADCPDKLCMKQGHISKESESIVCLPNKVVVSVTSDDSAEYDSMAK